MLLAVAVGTRRTSITLTPVSNLHDTSQGVDYLVITHPDFLAQAQQLAVYRAATDGFRTAVVSADDIYNEFNGGVRDPKAIRDFIFYVAHYWQPPVVSHVVLMGDGNYDPLNFLNANEPTYIPPWLAAVDPFQGETAADNRYVNIFGNDEYDSDGDAASLAHNIVIENGHMEMAVDFGFHQQVSAAGVADDGMGRKEPALASDHVSRFTPHDAQSPTTLSPNLVKAIGNMVFWDEDHDGIWDHNERGAEGVTVNLWSGGSIVDTQVTDVDGYYYFEDISSSTYQIQVLPPSGFEITLQDQGTDDAYDSDVNPTTGFTVDIPYTYGQAPADNWDAGLYWSGVIGNRVWEDLNANGLQDSSEPGMAGVKVELLQGGSVISTTTTDAAGDYFFRGLADGTYEVQVAASNFSGVLAGYVISPWDQGLDTMPDLALGRFPVNNITEASEMVNRVITYETGIPSGDWQKRIVFVADNPDPAGNFYAHSDEVANNLWPYPSFEQKVYYLSNYTNSTDMKNAIINGINQGALFVTYNGHSSKRTWGDGFFDRVDINSLSNTVFPIFLPMTCLEGQFINPGFISMGEQAVRTPGKGAVASFSPTGLGVATGHQFLYNTFFQALDGGETELGALTVAAKQALFESHSLFRDLLDTYILLGDPALHVQVPSANPGISKSVSPGGSIGPGDVLTYTLTYENTGLITATNTVITDILPAGLINPSTTTPPRSRRMPVLPMCGPWATCRQAPAA